MCARQFFFKCICVVYIAAIPRGIMHITTHPLSHLSLIPFPLLYPCGSRSVSSRMYLILHQPHMIQNMCSMLAVAVDALQIYNLKCIHIYYILVPICRCRRTQVNKIYCPSAPFVVESVSLFRVKSLELGLPPLGPANDGKTRIHFFPNAAERSQRVYTVFFIGTCER